MKATEAVATHAQALDIQSDDMKGYAFMDTYGAFLTDVYTSLAVSAVTFLFMSYRWSNYLFTALHDSDRFYFFFGLFTLAVLFTHGPYFLVAEVMFVVLIASAFYPPKEGPEEPKGRKPIPVSTSRLRTTELRHTA